MTEQLSLILVVSLSFTMFAMNLHVSRLNKRIKQLEKGE